MSDLISTCGAAAGVRWARNLAITHKSQDFLATLDHLFEADNWNYRLVYRGLVQPFSNEGDRPTAADDWWNETSRGSWPDSEADQAIFVRAFVIAAAFELRSRQFS